MKKVLFFLLLLTSLMFVNINAQEIPFRVGVKGGINLSNIGGNIKGVESKVGFLFGITTDYIINNDLLIVGGLEFVTKGTKSKVGSETINLSYLQLPIHMGYKIYRKEDLNLTLHAGPYFAYGLSAKYKDNYIDNGYRVEKDVNLYEKYDGNTILKRFDLGIGIGLSAELKRMNFGIGCDFGLSNIMNDKLQGESGKGKMRNQNYYLTTGYKF